MLHDSLLQDREVIRRFRTEADVRYAAIARSARDILDVLMIAHDSLGSPTPDTPDTG